MQSLSSVQPSVLPIAKKFFREPPSCLSKMFSCFGAQEAVVSAEDQEQNEQLVTFIKEKIRDTEGYAANFTRFMVEHQKNIDDPEFLVKHKFQVFLGLNGAQFDRVMGFLKHRNPGCLRPFYTDSASAFLKAVGCGFVQRHFWRVDMFWKMRSGSSMEQELSSPQSLSAVQGYRDRNGKVLSFDKKVEHAICSGDVQTLQGLMKSPKFDWNPEARLNSPPIMGLQPGPGNILQMNVLHLAVSHKQTKVLETLLNGMNEFGFSEDLLQQHCFFDFNSSHLRIYPSYYDNAYKHSVPRYTPAMLATLFQDREVLTVFLKRGCYRQEDFNVAVQCGYLELVDFINSSVAQPFPLKFESCFYPASGFPHEADLSVAFQAEKRNVQTRYVHILRFLKRFLQQYTGDPGELSYSPHRSKLTTHFDPNNRVFIASMDRSLFESIKGGKQETLLLLAGHPRANFRAFANSVTYETKVNQVMSSMKFGDDIFVRKPLDGLHPNESGSADVMDFLKMPNTGVHRTAFLARGLQLAVKYQCPVAATYFLEQGAVWDKKSGENQELLLDIINENYFLRCDGISCVKIAGRHYGLLAVLSFYGLIDPQVITDLRTKIKEEEYRMGISVASELQALDMVLKEVLQDRNVQPVRQLIHGLLPPKRSNDDAGSTPKPTRELEKFAANEIFDRNVLSLISEFTCGVAPKS